MKRGKTSNLSFLLLILVIAIAFSYLWQSTSQQGRLDYSQVRQLFSQEKVESFSFPNDDTIALTLTEELNGSKTVTYELYDFQLFYDDLNDLVQEQYAKGIIKHEDALVKVLGDGELTKALTVSVDKVSASAKAKIEAAGGKVEEPC